MGTNLPTILPSTFLFHLLNPSSISYSRRYLPSHLSYPTFPPSYHFRRCLPPGSSIMVYDPIQQQPVVYSPSQASSSSWCTAPAGRAGGCAGGLGGEGEREERLRKIRSIP